MSKSDVSNTICNVKNMKTYLSIIFTLLINTVFEQLANSASEVGGKYVTYIRTYESENFISLANKKNRLYKTKQTYPSDGHHVPDASNLKINRDRLICLIASGFRDAERLRALDRVDTVIRVVLYLSPEGKPQEVVFNMKRNSTITVQELEHIERALLRKNAIKGYYLRDRGPDRMLKGSNYIVQPWSFRFEELVRFREVNINCSDV